MMMMMMMMIMMIMRFWPIISRTLSLFLSVMHSIVSFAGCGRALNELFGNLQVRSSHTMIVLLLCDATGRFKMLE